LGGKKGGKYYWDPEIIFGAICSFSIIGNDEKKVSDVYIKRLITSVPPPETL
jgi:hypothetical protein